MATSMIDASALSGDMRHTTHETRLSVLRLIIAFTAISTALHYAHNYFQIEHYPPADFATNNTIKVAILISWPLLTAIGMLGYALYARRGYAPAYVCLIAYSLLGLVTLGHFTEGSPHIGPFWYATIFTDAIGGVALLAFVAWSAATTGPDAPKLA